MLLELQAAYKTQDLVLYAGKYYRTITVQPLLIQDGHGVTMTRMVRGELVAM